MTIPLITNPGGLFTRVGKVSQWLLDINTFRGATTGTDVNNIEAQFQSTDQNVIDGIYGQRDTSRTLHNSLATYLQTLSQNIVIQMANDDVPLSTKTLSNALILLISQMKTNAQSIQKPTISATPTNGGANVGNAVAAVSVLDFDGLQLDNIFNETITLTCTTDAQAGGTAGRELWSVVGQNAESNQLMWDWPLGSAASSQTTAISGLISNNGNLLNNSSFESFTSNVPNQWTIGTGTAGGTILAGGSGNAFDGSNCLEFAGNGAENTSLYQQFSTSTGTLTIPTVQGIYGVNLWLKVSSVPAAGVLSVELVDGNNNPINDTQGNNNAFTVSLPGATTSYVSHTGFFRLPLSLPPVVRLRLRLSTALSNGVNLFMDRLALAVPTQAYLGGPWLNVFSGPTNTIRNDTISVAVSNAYNSLWALYSQKLFNMVKLGLKLPSSGAPTVPDSLI